MYSYVLDNNIEKSGFNRLSEYLLFFLRWDCWYANINPSHKKTVLSLWYLGDRYGHIIIMVRPSLHNAGIWNEWCGLKASCV